MKNKEKDTLQKLQMVISLAPPREGEIKPHFFLIGYVPASIVWEDGTKQNIELKQYIEIEYTESLKNIASKRFTCDEAQGIILDVDIDRLKKKMLGTIREIQLANTLAGKKFRNIDLI